VKENEQFEIPKKLPSGSLKSTNLKMGTSVDNFGLTLLNILVLKKGKRLHKNVKKYAWMSHNTSTSC